MILTLTIPDELSEELAAAVGEPSRAALEALAAKAYASGHFSLEHVRRLLNLPSRWEAQEALSRHGVWPGTTVGDLRSDLANLEQFFALSR